MADSHHHHYHKKDDATLFKEQSLRAIRLRRLADKWGKIVLAIIALVMIVLVLLAYTVG